VIEVLINRIFNVEKRSISNVCVHYRHCGFAYFFLY